MTGSDPHRLRRLPKAFSAVLTVAVLLLMLALGR
jgi:hypothetical protein